MAAMTNHTALTVSPRKNAMTAQANAPSTAITPKMMRCLPVIGDRSMIATGGRSLSLRTKVMAPRVSSVRSGAVCDPMRRSLHRARAALGLSGHPLRS